MALEHFASLPDPELIEACLKKKNQAWEALLVRYQRLIYSIPLRYGLSEHDAGDVFQNVSLLLLENLTRLRDRQRLGAWLVITTRRECWRMLRQRQKSVRLVESSIPGEQTPGGPPSEEDFIALERQSLVRAALELMGAPCRQLLTLLFFAEPRPAYDRIARELGLPEGSIGPTRARCLSKLMKLLDKMGLSEL